MPHPPGQLSATPPGQYAQRKWVKRSLADKPCRTTFNSAAFVILEGVAEVIGATDPDGTDGQEA